MKQIRAFYRKHWTGYTSNTLGGRDDGYPEPMTTEYNTVEELAEHFGKHDNERYEFVQEMSRPLHDEDVKQIVAIGLKKIQMAQLDAELQKDMAEFERLRQKLAVSYRPPNVWDTIDTIEIMAGERE